MEVLTRPYKRLNQWDKDSVRPGPVGTVGDVNLQVKLRKSSPDMANRYEAAFSGKNEVWSGSNISDGMWYGYTSGGRGAITLTEPWNNRDGFKTAVGYRFQNIVATDRSRETKLTPLGRYGWDTTVGAVLKAKVSGDLFLPAPGGYRPTGPPRGSQYPRIIETSTGAGEALPAADVPITDPTFGDTGKIELPTYKSCKVIDNTRVYVPFENDPRRSSPPPENYPYRRAFFKGSTFFRTNEWPELGDQVLVWDKNDDGHEKIDTSPCGGLLREFALPDLPPITVPKPGNQDRRREDRKKEKENEKNKKQKIR